MFVKLFEIVENMHHQVNSFDNSKNRYLDTYSGEFYDEEEYEALPECVKSDIIQIPKSDWRTAAEDFLEVYFNTKRRLQFKEKFSVKDSDFGSFWSEMARNRLDWEWRRFYADFIFEKAKKWCKENGIHYTDNFHPYEKKFAL